MDIAVIVLFLGALYLLKFSIRKGFKLTERNCLECHAMHDTFSLTSYWIVKASQYWIVAIIVQYLTTINLMLLPQLPLKIWNMIFLFIYRPITYVTQFGFFIMYLLICTEHYVIRYLIVFEKKRTIGDLAFIYNNTTEFRQREAVMRKKLLAINLFLVITFFLNMVSNFILNTKDYEVPYI